MTTILLDSPPIYLSKSTLFQFNCINLYRYITGSTRTCVALIPMLRGDNVVLAKATFSDADTNFNGAIYFVNFSYVIHCTCN